MAKKNFENLRKWVQSLFAPLRPFRSELKENFYDGILPHVLLMCTHIFRYLVTGCHEKLSSSYRWYQKRTVGPTFVRTESLLSREIFRNVLGDFFYRGLYVVVHLCWNFSFCRQMAPVQSIKFQTANFPIFCARIIVIFCTTYIARKVFSIVIMGNGKQVLSVLHWLEVVIAFVSSSWSLLSQDGLKMYFWKVSVLGEMWEGLGLISSRSSKSRLHPCLINASRADLCAFKCDFRMWMLYLDSYRHYNS